MIYTAIIPARSGSKRLPNKNIRELAGKPLIVWTLEACVNVEKIDNVILSTDSMEYWNLAKKYIQSEKLELDFRKPEEAGDSVKIFDYLKEGSEKIFKHQDGAFILALPTVPLRTSKHLEEAINLFENENAPVFSAAVYGFPVSFAFYCNDDGSWKSIVEDNPMITGHTRSQSQKMAYHPNGAIYVRNISDLNRNNLNTLYQDARPYLMDRDASVDIDREIDFLIADALIQKNI